MRIITERRLRKFVVFLVVILFLLLVILSFLFLGLMAITFFGGHSWKTSGEKMESRWYKSSKFNSRTNSSSLGFVSLPVDMNIDEFMYYRESNDPEEHVLISNFGDVEYKCTGSCYCDEQERRSLSATQSTGRVFLYLVAAASSLFAVEEARKLFKDECTQLLEESGTCSRHTIMSKMDDFDVECEEWPKPFKDGIMRELKKQFGEKDGKVVEKQGTFVCRGNCIKMPDLETLDLHGYNEDLLVAAQELQGQIRDFPCKEKSLAAVITTDFITEDEAVKKYGSSSSHFLEHLEQAKWSFALKHLNLWCEDRSAIPIPSSASSPGKAAGANERIPICYGFYLDRVVQSTGEDGFPSIPMEMINPTIECRREEEP